MFAQTLAGDAAGARARCDTDTADGARPDRRPAPSPPRAAAARVWCDKTSANLGRCGDES